MREVLLHGTVDQNCSCILIARTDDEYGCCISYHG